MHEQGFVRVGPELSPEEREREREGGRRASKKKKKEKEKEKDEEGGGRTEGSGLCAKPPSVGRSILSEWRGRPEQLGRVLRRWRTRSERRSLAGFCPSPPPALKKYTRKMIKTLRPNPDLTRPEQK